MKTFTRLNTLLLSSMCTFVTHLSFAQPDDFTPGLSGSISLNVGVSQSQSQSSTHDDNAITPNLTNNGKQTEQVLPFILGRLQYSFGDTLLFLGNSEDQIAEAQFQAELGLSQKLSKNTTLTGALFGNAPSMDEVWQDPYLTNQERISTEQTVRGARVALDLNVLIPIKVKYAFAQSKVDHDNIGVSQGLSIAEANLLSRKSDYHRFGTEVTLPLARSFILSPAFYYTMRDAQGDAKSFDELSAQLSILFSKSRHNLITTVRTSQAEFDSQNPVFNLKQDYDSLGIFSVYSYHSPFNWKNTQVHVMAGYQQRDSDIDFYDTDSTFLSSGMSYSF